MTVYRDDVEVAAARGGENLRLRLNGIDEDDIAAGFVICSRNVPVPCVTYFDAQLQILDLLEHKVGFQCLSATLLCCHTSLRARKGCLATSGESKAVL